MAVFVSRKKPRLSKKLQADELGFFHSFLAKILLRVPTAFFVLVFIFIWSSSTTAFSGNIVHVCVSSRKLNNLYCLSAGTQPNFQIPVQLVNDSSSADNAGEVVDFGIKGSSPADNSSDSKGSNSTDNRSDSGNTLIPADIISSDNKSSIPADNSYDSKSTSILADNSSDSKSSNLADNSSDNKSSSSAGNIKGSNSTDNSYDSKNSILADNSYNSKSTSILADNSSDSKSSNLADNSSDNKSSSSADNSKGSNSTDNSYDSGSTLIPADIVSSDNKSLIPADNSSDRKSTSILADNSYDSKNSILVVNDTLESAYRHIEEQLQLHRSWISGSNPAKCEGRGIYVYELPPKFNKDLSAQCGDMIPWADFCSYLSNDGLGKKIDELGSNWYNTHQYALEPIFHARVLKHPCRVLDPNEAKLFYVPYYGGLDVLRWHFTNASNDVKDTLAVDLVRWLETQGPWYRMLGRDHVFVLGKISWDFRRNDKGSWGTRFLELDEMQNPIKLLIERQPWHANDVGIPHPTYFHPHTDDDIVVWQIKLSKIKRTSVVSFAGAARPGSAESIRSILIEQCTSAGSGNCRFLDCTSGQCDDRPDSIMGLFTESEFCLQPPGDSPTRKSVFDSLISGCIPVLFDPLTAYYQYPWHLPEDSRKYSVFIDKEEVRNKSVNVVERLVKIPARERENMRRYIVYELLPGLVYGDLDSKFDKFQDAFSLTMNNLLERVSRLNDVRD